MRTPIAGGVRIGAHFNTNEYIHEQTTIGFGVHISSRKYLNCCTPFSDASQWNGFSINKLKKVGRSPNFFLFLSFGVIMGNAFCSSNF